MFYGYSRRHGLVVPNPDPQFGNQSEHRIARTRPAADRPSQRLWAHRGFKPNAAARSFSRGVTNPWNSPTTNWRKFMTARTLLVLIAPLLVMSGCGATIHGTVLLVDSRQQPIANESPKGAVVNMINTTAAVEQASSSATVDEKGEFESPKDAIKPGVYKVEASRIGYETQTATVEVGSFGKKVEFKLKKIDEAKR